MTTIEGSLPGSAVRRRLREETRALHEELEARLDLLGPAVDLARYRGVLAAFLGWYEPVEALLRDGPSLGLPPPPWSARLAADLAALGLSGEAIRRLPRATALPRLDTEERRAGCLYVLEGAALGGGVIARALADRLGLHAGNGAAFFSGGGDAAGARWAAFLATLGHWRGAPDAIVAAARETFVSLRDWLDRTGVLR